MKVCPSCDFSNDECFPTCVFCNRSLVDVASIPAADPDHPEHAQRALVKERSRYIRRQVWSAGILYALVMTIMAAVSGLVSSPLVLLLYFLSGIVVVIAIERNVVGQFTASFLQGFLSTILLVVFGPEQPLIFFMLVGQIVAASYFWQWMDLIHSANR